MRAGLIGIGNSRGIRIPKPLIEQCGLGDRSGGSKTRPCLVVSPDELNQHLRTAVIAPMTTAVRPYLARVAVTFEGNDVRLLSINLRAVDRQRLVRKPGTVQTKTAEAVSSVLVEMFTRE